MNYIKCIEKLNLDYLKLQNSNIYKSGEKFNHIINYKPYDYLKCVYRYHIYKTMKQTFVNENMPKTIQNRLARLGSSSIKVVVYSCLTNYYDPIKNPYFEKNNIDYILYVDKLLPKTTTWTLRILDDELKNKYSYSLLNRYVKFHPFEFFEGNYDYAIYIDSNVVPISDLSVLCELINPKYGLAFHSHCTRNCIFEEEKACKALNKGHSIHIRQQLNEYKNKGFPVEYGMVEGNIFVVDLKNKTAKYLLESCWNEFIHSKSERDQLAWPYILWLNNIKPQEISTLGKNAYMNPKFRIYPHKSSITK